MAPHEASSLLKSGTDGVSNATHAVGDAVGDAAHKVCDCAGSLRRVVEATFVAGAEDTHRVYDASAHGLDDAKHKLEEASAEVVHKMEVLLPTIVMTVWVACSIFLVYFTKWTLSATDDEKHPGAGFTFPVFYTLCTSMTINLGCILLLTVMQKKALPSFEQFKLSWQGILGVAALSVVSIWASDASLMYIGITLNQLMKACTPLPTMALSYFIERKRFAWPMVLAVVLIVCGAGLAVPASDSESAAFGIIMALTSTLATAAALSLKARLMANSAANGLTPLVLLFYSSGASVPVLLLWFLCIDEREEVGEFFEDDLGTFFFIVGIASVLAFICSLAGNTLTKVTSALTLTVVGAAKQIGVIVVTGVFIDQTFKAPLNIAGVCLFIGAVVLYAFLSYNKKFAAKTLPFPDFGQMAKDAAGSATGLAQKGVASVSTGVKGVAAYGTSKMHQ